MLHIPKLSREGDFVHIIFNTLEVKSLRHTHKATHDYTSPHVICEGLRYPLQEARGVWSCKVPCSISHIIYGDYTYAGEI